MQPDDATLIVTNNESCLPDWCECKNARFGNNQGISEDIKRDLIQKGAIFEDSPWRSLFYCASSLTIVVKRDRSSNQHQNTFLLCVRN
jgi:hypothetical protein